MKVCPLCQRQFATKRALAQHRSAAHAPKQGGPVRQRANRGGTQTRAGNGSMSTTVSAGADLVQSVVVRANAAVGQLLMIKPLGPANLDPSRWRNESALWSRWRPQALTVSVVGAGASTTYGSVVIGWSPDPHWVQSKSANDYMRVAALRPSVTMRLFETRTLSIPCETLLKWYTCDGVPDMSCHGALICVVASTPGGFSGSLGVNVTLQWRVQFEGVEMPTATHVIADVITPDAGWENIFTTSDGSFDATKLTFKETSGGSMVPFTSARKDHVYTSGDGTVVKYYDSSSASKECTWFAKIQSQGHEGMLLFSSKADATAYVKTGDLAKALTYTRAGPTVTPSVPTFKGEDPDWTRSTEVMQVRLEMNRRLEKVMELIRDTSSIEALRRSAQLLAAVNTEQPFE